MKNIIFDLGGVLIKGKASSVLNKFNTSDEERNQLMRFFTNYVKMDLGTQTIEDRFNECNFSDEIITKYKDKLLRYYEYREYNMELLDLINKLKQKKYKVYILSDNVKEAFNYYISNQALKNLDGYICSCDYGVAKEDGKLFEVLLSEYNLNPSECYFVDDKQYNIEIAKRYNIKGYKYNENEDITILYNDMKNNGINI